ncbi:phosphotransferase family protein [Variovorax sp. dw_308]|uniref:phosphotransferase family protein n=1 Tax=Variovorax sp. dw_308 TaxID=2721546 RepID=UPI001C444F6C|nr:phosphotransferase family protein [Variovorax sp. dw_308]
MLVRDESKRVVDGLQAFAATLVPGGAAVRDVRRLSGGASQQTWAFEVDAGAQTWPLILRRAADATGERAMGSAGLAAEAQLIEVARAGGVPVPGVRHVLRASDGLGDGFIMDRIEGETLGRRIVREARLTDARHVLAYQCGAALARIHRLPVNGLPPLRRADACAELDFQIEIHRGHGTPRPVFEIAFQWLRAHAPADMDMPALVHGDYRNGNLIVGEEGLRAVLDWELAHLGDPMEDLGWMCVRSWRFGNGQLPVGGFGTREQLLEGYASEGGVVDVDRVRWWEVMGSLKWGVICGTMLQAWRSGRERDVEKAVIGRRASEAESDLLALLAPEGEA